MPSVSGRPVLSHPFALLVIDIVNNFDYAGAAALRRHALRAVDPLARLLARARAAGLPVIYANDNFDKWQSNFPEQVARASAPSHPAAALLAKLTPDPADYYILKPRHSAFYATPLDLLLSELGTREIIATGIATDSCVWMTCCDAHVRGYRVTVAGDCVAAQSRARSTAALQALRDVIAARVIASDGIRLRRARARRRNL
jgi:nicotinamidase-related amidase